MLSRFKWCTLFLFGVLMLLSSPLHAGITFQFTGSVSEDYLSTGSVWYPVQPGDTINFDITLDQLDNWKPISYALEITNQPTGGGQSINFSYNDLSGFIGQWYDPKFDTQGKLIDMYYDLAGPNNEQIKLSYQDGFGESELRLTAFQNQQLAAISVYSNDLQAVPIPAAAWLLGTGVIGLAALKRKMQK